MPKKYLKTYKELATSRGYSDPLEYLFSRMKSAQAKGDHRAAQQLATLLLPYGHFKAVPRDDEGEIIESLVIVRES